MIMEYCGGKDLNEYISYGSMSEFIAREYFRDILEALLFMKKIGMVHRDIKPGNILFSDKGIIKLADFGTA